MTFSQIFEVAISLMLIYYVLGSLVSLMTQLINEAFETRGKSLERQLMKIVGNNQVGDFVKIPQLDALRPIRYKNMFSFLTAKTEPKKLEKVPVSTLVNAYFDFTGLTANTEISTDGLKNILMALPPSEGKTAIIKWVDQGVTNIDDLRNRTTAYFSGVMNQAAATFKSNARSFVIMLSILLTLLLGTDSIQLMQRLWTNASLRALTVAKAEMIVQAEGIDASPDDLLKQLDELDIIRIGWWVTELPTSGSSVGQWLSFILLKILGLSLTVVAVSQGSSFWYDLLKRVSTPASSSSSASSGGGSSSSSSSSSG